MQDLTPCCFLTVVMVLTPNRFSGYDNHIEQQTGHQVA